MHEWAIRDGKSRAARSSFQIEVLPTGRLPDDEVMVLVMAAGVNYNGVWAGLGSRSRDEGARYHHMPAPMRPAS